MPKNKRVSYYFDTDTGAFSYGLGHVMKPHRIKMAHSLISAYDMLPKLEVLVSQRIQLAKRDANEKLFHHQPTKATAEQMTRFHTDEYVHFLKRVTPDTAAELSENGTKFLTGMDNPPYEGAFEFCSISAGGSISGAQRLSSGSTDIAINWAGGLHHAKKNGASGFCYINDIVLGILELLRTFPRVLYVDVDCHHGDAVEEAFYTSERVLTVSLHKFGDFFPGTGFADDRGVGKGWRYSLNVPFRSGLSDANFQSIYVPLMDRVLARFRPSAVVLQCGADSLAGDRLGQYNVSMEGHADCVRYFRDKGIPLMVLGGGGYTIRNVARTWAYETACILNIEKDLDKNLPYNPYFEYFGPEYKLEVKATNMEDLNESDRYLEGIRETVLRQADEIPIAPSVGIHMPPRHSLAEELGLGLDGTNHVEGDYDDIDLRIQEIATQFMSTPTDDSDTDEDLAHHNGWDPCAAGAVGANSDEEYPDTPTRSRRGANYVGNSAHNRGDKFSRGVIPVPNTGLLFANHNGRTSTNNRPPDSVGSVFGTGGRTVDPRNGRLAELMENGGRTGDEDVFMDSPQRAPDMAPPAGGVSPGMTTQAPPPPAIPKVKPPPPRRFFKSSGIRLLTNQVRFPTSILQGDTGYHSAWGPAGFGGFGNDEHVMRRGFGLSYGGYGQGGVVADANRVEEEVEEAEEEEEELGRGRRRSRREVEEMVVDGGESE